MNRSAVWAPRTPRVWPARLRAGLGSGAVWAFGVGAPLVCFGLAWDGGWFGSTRVLVFGYALCCVAAFTARRLLQRPRPALDAMLAGLLAGAFLFALPFGVLFGYLGAGLLIPGLFRPEPETLVLAVLGLGSFASTVVYGRAAWRAQSKSPRRGAWCAGLAAPALVLLAVQSVVWGLVARTTPRLVAAIDAGVPVEEIELGAARILGPLSDWPGLAMELEGDSGAANQRDRRIASLYERLTGHEIKSFWSD